MTIDIRTTIQGESGYIELSEGKVDYLITNTYTRTYYNEDYWKERQVSMTIDPEKAKDFIELLTEYVKYKEGKG